MTPAEQKRRRLGLLEGARPAGAGEGFAGWRIASRQQPRAARRASRTQMSFYGALAAEDLGQAQTLPPGRRRSTPAERDVAASDPGLARALTLVAIGLRPEGVREWNYSIRGLGDRELLAAAQLACEREVWDRCINTSEQDARRDRRRAALPDAAAQGSLGAGARDRPRPGLRLRPDSPGVAASSSTRARASAPPA